MYKDRNIFMQNKVLEYMLNTRGHGDGEEQALEQTAGNKDKAWSENFTQRVINQPHVCNTAAGIALYKRAALNIHRRQQAANDRAKRKDAADRKLLQECKAKGQWQLASDAGLRRGKTKPLIAVRRDRTGPQGHIKGYRCF